MNYGLPKSLEIGGKETPILWDYRAALDILAVLQDPDLSDSDRVATAIFILYPESESFGVSDYREAAEKMTWYINGGNVQSKRGPKLMDWEQDIQYIIAPVNRIIGREIREDVPLHWWTFLSAYYEIGECTFSQIVKIRDLKVRGKKMEKQEREWYNRNREIVDFKSRYSTTDKNTLNDILGLK